MWSEIVKLIKRISIAVMPELLSDNQIGEEIKEPRKLTIEQYNKEIDESEARYDAGEFTPLEDVIRQAESW
jgi:hypothetical protein